MKSIYSYGKIKEMHSSEGHIVIFESKPGVSEYWVIWYGESLTDAPIGWHGCHWTYGKDSEGHMHNAMSILTNVNECRQKAGIWDEEIRLGRMIVEERMRRMRVGD